MTPEDEEIYEKALDIVLTTKTASTSFLQRKLGIGYARAARMVDLLEKRGVIGPGEGAKRRQVYDPSEAPMVQS